MIWRRVILSWLTLLALVFASAGATGAMDVSPKPHVGAIDMVAAICIEAHGLASGEGHQGNWDAATTGTSDVPDAARAAPKVVSDVILKGGRSGSKVKSLVGPPNAAVRGGGQRAFVTNDKGQVILDITKARVKPVTPGQGFGPKRAPTEAELKLLEQVLGGAR